MICKATSSIGCRSGVRVRESFSILRGDQVAARVHNALVDPLRERFQIEIPGGQDMTALGKFIWAEYRITAAGSRSPRSRRNSVGFGAINTPSTSPQERTIA